MNSDKVRETGTSMSRATILVVDDEPQNLAVLGGLLAPLYRVRAADSGGRALAAAAGEPRPDLILLDVMMPGMDGLEVLRRLRADEATRDIPVIFVTSLQDPDDELRGFEMGAADYIHKPVKRPVLLSRVRAQLDAKAARDMLKHNNLRLVNRVVEGTHALEQTQLQLLQSEKMVAMGQLAAGVAHEINNPIGFVGSNLRTLEGYLDDIFCVLSAYERAETALGKGAAFDHVREAKHALNYDFLRQDILALLAESEEGIERVRRIVKDLKDFSRAGETDWQWADLHQGIDSTLNIVRNELKYHCAVIKHYGTLPLIRCLPSQLNQVFMNLLVNAGQAIEGKGEITITTERAGADAVRVVIRDSGKGMAPESLQHIFEPFFTTKPVGKGTGLGLSLAWSIIERHRGKIEVESEPGEGSAFTVTLPVEPAAASDPGAEAGAGA